MRNAIFVMISTAIILNGCGSMMGEGTHVLGLKMPYKECREVITEEYPVGKEPCVVVRNPNGDVRINVWEKERVKLTATKVVRAMTTESARKYMDKIKIATEGKDNILHISTVPHSWSAPAWRETNYALLVPCSTSLDIRTSYGEVSVNDSAMASDVEAERGHASTCRGLEGDITIKNSHGCVRVRDIHANLKVANSHGEALLSDVQGQLEIKNIWGSTKVSDITGELNLRGSQKPLFIENVKGNVSVSNSHGRVEVRCVEGDLHITNKHADVLADGVTGQVVISNSHGDITVRAFEIIEKKYTLCSEHGNITLESILRPN